VTKSRRTAAVCTTAIATTTVIEDSLFDIKIKIKIVTAGLIPYYRRLLKDISEENALTIAKYILAMKTEINLSDQYTRHYLSFKQIINLL
jgi:hypothetical protein